MQINYHKKTVYGVEHMYITDSKIAASVRTLTSKKTIDGNDIAALTNLGHEVKHSPIN